MWIMAEQDHDSTNNVKSKKVIRAVAEALKADRETSPDRDLQPAMREFFIFSMVFCIFVTLLIGSLMIWG